MPNSALPSDDELVQRMRRRDQSALSELYQQYSRPVFSLALRILQNNALAEEVTQDTFLKVWYQADSWDPQKGKLISWLLTITRYTAIDLLRKEQRRPVQSAIPLDDILELAGKKSFMDDPRWQDGRLIQSLMSRLPVEQAQVIELSFYQGMSHSEMAESLKLPLGTIKTRVRLGLQKLKDMWIDAVGYQDA